MTEPRIVKAQEAQEWIKRYGWTLAQGDLMHTVATEPDRTRAAVVKALRDAISEFAEGAWADQWLTTGVSDDVSAVQSTDAWFTARANAIENGADL